MDIEEHARGALIAYFLARKRWRETPPQHKADKESAKDLRDATHGKLLALGGLLAEAAEKHKKEN